MKHSYYQFFVLVRKERVNALVIDIKMKVDYWIDSEITQQLLFRSSKNKDKKVAIT